MDKVRVIKRSLLCYNLGWLGFVPLLGMLPALMAIGLWKDIRREVGSEWNPAKKYAFWGGLLGIMSFLVSLAIGALLLAKGLSG